MVLKGSNVYSLNCSLRFYIWVYTDCQTVCRFAFGDRNRKFKQVFFFFFFFKRWNIQTLTAKHQLSDKGVKLWSVVKRYTNSSMPGTGLKPFEVRNVFTLHYMTKIYNSDKNTAASGGSSTYCRNHNKAFFLWKKRPRPFFPSGLCFTEKQSDTIIVSGMLSDLSNSST